MTSCGCNRSKAMKGKMMTGKSKVISTGKGVTPPGGMKTAAAKKGGKMMPPALLEKMKKKG